MMISFRCQMYKNIFSVCSLKQLIKHINNKKVNNTQDLTAATAAHSYHSGLYLASICVPIRTISIP